MSEVRAKKHLGQHFLTDNNIASKIARSIEAKDYSDVLEVGPGTGMLTALLIERKFDNFKVIEIDKESVDYLSKRFHSLDIIRGDFLKIDLNRYFNGKMGIIGNFPYNISSQILFRVLEYRDKVCEVTGMLQKEVAERIVSEPGSKVYGILSVLLQAFYDVYYLFTVPQTVFNPQPKVKSAAIRLVKKEVQPQGFDVDLFFRIVKITFNQRRKMIRNSLKPLTDTGSLESSLLDQRPEQLGVKEFIELTKTISHGQDN